MFQNVQCLMFDLDGTIVDSEAMATRIFLHEINKQLQLGMDAEEYDATYLGRDAAFMEEDLALRYGKALPASFISSLKAAYHAAIETELEASHNIEGALQQLDLPCCIVSNSSASAIDLSIKSVGLASYFNGNYFSGAEVARAKPAPDVYIEAARSMGFEPSACLAIEDSTAGMAAATAAGFQLLGYAGNTIGHADEFLRNGIYVIHDFKELPDLL